MRIIQTVNDTIRLLFNPKTEVFRLSDFLLVRDIDENFLAQVIEVYDDKFDQEANVAKIKLIYRIVNGNEIEPFDNYTPSRECEVAKIKQSEIEKCINLKKKTITLGTSYFSKQEMKINTDFFENNCVIFADKFEQTNQIFENLAPRLTEIKPVLILDFSGNCKIDNINPYVAGENFKLPLSSNTIDYIQQKTLIRAKLETQVVLSDVFDEVKKYLETAEEDYIPFQRFIKVIKEQCKKTPSVELLVLISWLKKYARENIFAKTKREFDGLLKSVVKNKITILDLSNIKTEWQKEFLEYLINSIQNDIFVLIRLNDNNINNDIINSIYLKKQNISLIPSFAYGYKKAPYIMDFAQNYVLMPTLNPKRDFTHANFQIQSLNKEAYLIFGEDTKDFIFTLENETSAKKAEKDDDKNKVFISLNLQLEDMTPLELRPNNFEIKQTEPRRKRLQEEIKLSDVLGVKDDENQVEKKTQDNVAQAADTQKEETPAQQEKPIEIEETIAENIVEKPIEESKDNSPEFFNEDELDYFEQAEALENEEQNIIENSETESVEEDTEIKEEVQAEEEITSEENNIREEETVEENALNLNEEDDNQPEVSVKKTAEEITEEAPKIKIQEELIEEDEIENNEDGNVSEIAQFARIQEDEETAEEITEESGEEAEEILEDNKDTDVKEEPADENEEEEDDEPADTNEEEPADENIEDETEDDAQIKEEEIKETDNIVSTIIDEVVQENIEKKVTSEETIQKLDEITNSKNNEDNDEDEIEKQFNEILNETEVETINKPVYDVEKIEQEESKQETKLPVFDDDKNENINVEDYKEGSKVFHEKYGHGEIKKVIQYSERCLLQIEFEGIGKRLLDPKIAKLTIEE